MSIGQIPSRNHSHHLHHMSNRMDRPGVLRIDLNRLTTRGFGSCVIARFLEAEGDRAGALEACRRAIEIQEPILSPDHPGLVATRKLEVRVGGG